MDSALIDQSEYRVPRLPELGAPRGALAAAGRTGGLLRVLRRRRRGRRLAAGARLSLDLARHWRVCGRSGLRIVTGMSSSRRCPL